VPPRVDYALTDVGCSLKPVIMALAAWGARNVVCDNGRNVIRLADETETASPGRDAA
jgi:DNA-binding HxlR family transcriptional regulator